MSEKNNKLNLDEKTQTRFIKSIPMGRPNECWSWKGPKNGTGYPQFHYNGRLVSARKILWNLIAEQQVPAGKVLTSTCASSDCMNPDHIKVTTRSGDTKKYLSLE